MFFEKKLLLRKRLKSRFNQEEENEYMIDFKIKNVLIKCSFFILIIIYFEIEKRFPNSLNKNVIRVKYPRKVIKDKSLKNKIKEGSLNENKSEKKIKACVCVVGKKENLYAKEYVNYYIKLDMSMFIYMIIMMLMMKSLKKSFKKN